MIETQTQEQAQTAYKNRTKLALRTGSLILRLEGIDSSDENRSKEAFRKYQLGLTAFSTPEAEELIFALDILVNKAGSNLRYLTLK